MHEWEPRYCSVSSITQTALPIIVSAVPCRAVILWPSEDTLSNEVLSVQRDKCARIVQVLHYTSRQDILGEDYVWSNVIFLLQREKKSLLTS